MKMKGTQFWLGGGGGGAEFQQTNYQSSHAPGFPFLTQRTSVPDYEIS